MKWLEQHRQEMRLLLSTVEAVVDFWPATHRADLETPRWVQDVSAVLGVLIERQANHFDLENLIFLHRFFPTNSSASSSAEAEALGSILHEHRDLATATRSVRELVGNLGPSEPLQAKQRVEDLIRALRKHEDQETLCLDELLSKLPSSTHPLRSSNSAPQPQVSTWVGQNQGAPERQECDQGTRSEGR